MALAPDIEGFSRLITALDPWLDRVVIVGGWADFPITKGSLPTPFRPGNSICQSSNCLANAFVTKIDPQTSQILYSTFIGGSGREAIRGLAVDSAGNAYVAGTTTSPDFPVTPGAAQTKFNAGNSSTHRDGFVAKLNPTRSALVYATYLGGSTDDEILDLALDSTGAVVVTGDGSYDFPVTAGALQVAILSGSTYGQLFVAKLDPSGRTLVFSAHPSPFGTGLSVALDSVGRVVVGGYIASGATVFKDGIWQFTGLLPMVNPLQAEGVPERTVCGGPPVGRDCKDGFLMVLDAEGRSLLLSSPLAGKSDDSVAKIQFDPSGNLYAFGHGMQGFRLPGTPDGASFVVKIEPVGPPPLAKGAALVNSADYGHAASGGLATLFGSGLTAATGVVTANTTPLPRELQGTTVWLGGIAAPLLAAANVNGQEQINIQVPFEHVFGYYGLTIRNQGRLGLVTSFSVWDWWPAVFTGADGQPAVLHADYTPVTASKPAHAGEVVLIYCTGLGSTTPPVATGAAADTAVLQRTVETVTVTLGGANAPVQFAGLAPGYVGLYQVNAQIPAMAGGPQPLTITVRGLETSKPVTMAVQ